MEFLFFSLLPGSGQPADRCDGALHPAAAVCLRFTFQPVGGRYLALLHALQSPFEGLAGGFKMPAVFGLHQQLFQLAGESIGRAGVLLGADDAEYGLFLRATFHVLLAELQTVSDAVPHGDGLYVLEEFGR